ALPLPERVMAVADLLHAESGFAEWSRSESGFEIRDYNCCYLRLSGDAGPCRWHGRVLAELLGEVCGVSEDDRASQVCRFSVRGATTHTNGAATHDYSAGATFGDTLGASASVSGPERPLPAR